MSLWRLCYVIVVDGEEEGRDAVPQPKTSFCYTKSVLQSVLQLVGCKVHHAVKISRRVFDILERENLPHAGNDETRGISFRNRNQFSYSGQRYSGGIQKLTNQPLENTDCDVSAEAKLRTFDLYKNRVTATVNRGRFLNAICNSLEEYHYVGPSQRDDIILACRLRERKESVTVLLCGTSGCGKSTLSSLLASRLGITTVVSTDSIRHMMRSFTDEKENPLLWASTYHAGEFLDPIAVAQAKARKKDGKLVASHGTGQHNVEESLTTVGVSFSKTIPTDIQYQHVKISDKRDVSSLPSIEQVGSKVLAIEG